MITRKAFASEYELPHYGKVPKNLLENLKFRRKILAMAAEDKQLAAAIKHACKDDFLFWMNTFAWTYDPRIDEKAGTEYGGLGSTLPFITWKFQDTAAMELIEAIRKGYDVTILKSRDMGATWLILEVLLWQWLFFDNKSFLILSRKTDLVDKKGNPDCMMAKLDFTFKWLPMWMKPSSYDRTFLHFANEDNGSVIDGESTTSDSGRAGRRTAIVPDEFASVPNGYEMDAATQSVTNCRIFNSTPKGAANAFFEKAHDKNMKTIKMMWWQHPVKSKGMYRAGNGETKLFDEEYKYDDDFEFIRDGKLRSPWYDEQDKRFAHPKLRAQELDCDFHASDFQYFDPELLRELKSQHAKDATFQGELKYDLDNLEPLHFERKPKGRLRLWLPLAEGQRPGKSRDFVIGCDISTGTGVTPSVASIVDRDTGEKVGEWACARTEPREFAKMVVALCRWFKGKDNHGAFLIWESNGPGGSFGKAVWEFGYRRIFYRKTNEKGTRLKNSETPGWFNNREASEVLMADYGSALKSRSFINHSIEALDDCKLYVFHKDGTIGNAHKKNDVDPSAATVNHADRVVADALAWRGCKELGRKLKGEKKEIAPVGSFAHRRKQWEREQMTMPLAGEEWMDSFRD